ncbi:O-fucosyltransferase 16 isoform X2 [Amaranthus tricolor]|uniref:O-fucosyltransferase 16 isoform X2 n=1 Tax=Amaranthus tricolor TaxID=29722 RepID=UPI00258755AB|nr:O-fucosyltransferase 16 isoform X2 [Amaranthus tricolor]
MAIHRRRHYQHSNNNRRFFPAITAVVGAFFLCFFVLSFLAPHPSRLLQHNRGRNSISASIDDAVASIGVSVDSVPASGGKSKYDIWRCRDSEFFYGCSNATSKFLKAEVITRRNRYLMIATSGGLNQQRTGIIDAVVAARILNATLVVPKLDQRSYWKDASNFEDIFDIDWFISSLSNDINILKELPNGPKVTTMRVPRKCNERCYEKRVLPVILKRFEPDMLAFSGCYYGGGDKERKELGAIRKRWKTLHGSNPDKARRQGRCPLTPEEVGLMLRALGYGKDVHIYVASGEVYRAEETLAPLKTLFPNFHSKDTIASKQELESFSKFSSRMAALDFIVCDESDVFVTNNNGNMAKILAGRRRYSGHKPTIRPNAKKLYKLFMNIGNMTWEEFSLKARSYQRGFMGLPHEVRPGRGEFHENPAACICEISDAKAMRDASLRKYGMGKDPARKELDTEDHDADDDMEVTDPDTDGDVLFHEKQPANETLGETMLDYDGISTDEPELEDMLSD